MKTDDSKSPYRVLNHAQILSWLDDDAQIMRLRSDRDVMPGGGMRRPQFRHWLTGYPATWTVIRQSIVLRHVNYGGNLCRGGQI